jgi:hypothetical protein
MNDRRIGNTSSTEAAMLILEQQSPLLLGFHASHLAICVDISRGDFTVLSVIVWLHFATLTLLELDNSGMELIARTAAVRGIVP